MESSSGTELRSRSRSKTPFLRSSCDRENCTEGGDHTHHKSGRKTPIKRSTPVKQLQKSSTKNTTETIVEETEHITGPVHRTRQATKVNAVKLVKTSDYSSEESLDRLKGNSKEVLQNELNSQYERVSTSSHRYGSFADVTLSPINTSHTLTYDRSTRYSSPGSVSACSTDSSFAEQARADASILLDRDPALEHLPSRLYRMAGEYWNKYPKTDYTYSPFSKDRVELAPGQVAVPNMSRRSLSHFRIHGPTTSADEVDVKSSAWSSRSGFRKRYTSLDSSDDESYARNNGGYQPIEQRWWITQMLLTIITTITTTLSNTYRKVVGPSHRYPYRDRRPAQAGLVTRAASAAAAPFYWIYSLIKTVITTTVTTVTETITPNHVGESEKYISSSYQQRSQKRHWWPWLLLLLPIAYGCYQCADQILPQKPMSADTYKPLELVQDPALTKRIAALEQWAFNVDNKLSIFNDKLSKLDSLESMIEQYSLKYMQQNLIQIFNMNQNSDAIAAKLKVRFDNDYVSKDQLNAMRDEIYERLLKEKQPMLSKSEIEAMMKEYMSVSEQQQMEVLMDRMREYLKVEKVEKVGGLDMEAVRKMVTSMLEVYDADKTGLVDYALESAGGQVISTKCTELYQIKTKQYVVLGLPVPWPLYTSPRAALAPGAMPADCWAFQGFPGYLVIRTYAIIEVTGFSLEHMSKLLAVDGKIESAPKNFSVYGLHGETDPEPHLFGQYMYVDSGPSIQYFPVQHPKTVNIGGMPYPVAYNTIELRIESNHGNPTYTCVYRFRVHGNRLSDIRQATEDSIRESET